jgi:hypothetical protein
MTAEIRSLRVFFFGAKQWLGSRVTLYSIPVFGYAYIIPEILNTWLTDEVHISMFRRIWHVSDLWLDILVQVFS